ncbi:MAG TPA: hypothetical protein VLY04_15520 [Bryobacteraceae bacterium]|nr:hypothetical protein [Bryobacteraceae bacterium]
MCPSTFSERPEAAGLEVHHVDQADEVHALLVETEPAVASRVLSISLEVGLAVVGQDVVLAGYVESRAGTDRGENRAGGGELLGFRKMADIAGMDEEGRWFSHRIYFGDGGLQSALDVGVGLFVEADVAVADLNEAQVALGRLAVACHLAVRGAAGERPNHAGAGPSHAFQETALINAVFFMIVSDVSCHGEVAWTDTPRMARLFRLGRGIFAC